MQNIEASEASTLTKAQLSALLIERVGLHKRDAKDMVDAFFLIITEQLMAGEDVKITGFGNFQIKLKSPRPGRNPRTGEAVPIQERHVVTFHASNKLKALIHGVTP
jgi:integration host factor subunit alpha